MAKMPIYMSNGETYVVNVIPTDETAIDPFLDSFSLSSGGQQTVPVNDTGGGSGRISWVADGGGNSSSGSQVPVTSGCTVHLMGGNVTSAMTTTNPKRQG